MTRIRTQAPVDPVARLVGQIKSLQQQVAELQRAASMQRPWTSYTPALTSSGTNPTLGTGSALYGRWKRTVDGLIVVRFAIVFGASGTSAGSGNYLIVPPVTPSVALGGAPLHNTLGTVWMLDQSANEWTPANWFADGAMRAAGGGLVHSSAPWAWGANDRLQATAIYEPA